MFREKCFVFLIVLNTFLLYCYCARILCIFSIPSISHQIVFRPLTKELAKRGHELVIITPDPTYELSPNIREIDLKVTYESFRKTVDFNKISEISTYQMLTSFEDSVYKIVEHQLSHKEVQELFKNKSEKFDLIICEYLVYPLAHVFRKKYNAQLIGIASMDVTIVEHITIKNLQQPYLYPNPHTNTQLFAKTFKDRLKRIYEQLVLYYVYHTKLMQRQRHLTKKYFEDEFENIWDSESCGLDLLFVNAHPALGYAKPVVSTFIDISGIHLQPVKPLPKDIISFLDSAKNGIILLSLGTNVKLDRLEDNIKENIFQAFSEMPSYKFLCKWEGNINITIPSNVRLLKWFPQNDVLAHPNIKLFIFQGGYQSFVEAVTHGVPTLGVPFTTDQKINTQIISHLAIGKEIDVQQANKDTLKESILSLIRDDKFKQNVMRLSKQLYDFPQTPLERAVWWTEYVLRNNGTKHLQPLVEDLKFHNFITIDMIIFFIILLFIFTAVVLFSCTLCRYVRKCNKKNIGNKKTK